MFDYGIYYRGSTLCNCGNWLYSLHTSVASASSAKTKVGQADMSDPGVREAGGDLVGARRAVGWLTHKASQQISDNIHELPQHLVPCPPSALV